MTHGLRPVGYNVLIKPTEVEKKTKGGLYMPDDTVEKEGFARIEGELIAVSPMAFSFDMWPEGMEDLKPKVGDTVLFAQYNAKEWRGNDGCTYWLMKDEAIIGVIEK